MSDTIPVTVLTGFLGSGKTTLLNRLLARPELADTAVVVNELGEIGIDHHLIREVSGESVVLLRSGCVCCSVRGDMVTALRDLFLKRVRGEIPDYRRLMIETTGLAEPAPILHTLVSDPLLGARYRLDGIVTTVDAVNAPTQLDRHPEAVRQIAVADRLVLTKTDLAAREAIDRTRARMTALNPAAPVIVARHGEADPETLLEVGLFTGDGRPPDVARWLAEDAYGHHHHHHHDELVASFVVTFDQPLPWEPFVAALESLIAAHGEAVLRVKGLLNVRGEDVPLAIHGVQHVFHPPAALPAWPDADRRSRIVFITRGLDRAVVEAALSPRAIGRTYQKPSPPPSGGRGLGEGGAEAPDRVPVAPPPHPDPLPLEGERE
ncbi:MAG: GTP-binding protein [Alphaproteobacteria bacterium]